MKTELRRRIEGLLDDLSVGEHDRLMGRENAAELCLLLSMNEKVVRVKFAVTKMIEEELGLTGKMPILESIWHLIHHIGIHNPFGVVTDGIIENYDHENVGGDGAPKPDYLGVEFKKGGAKQLVKEVEQILAGAGYMTIFSMARRQPASKK